MENIEDLKKQLEELKEKIDKMEKQEKTTERWRAEKDHKYYTILEGGGISFNFEAEDNIDDFLYKTRNYFKTKEEAEKRLEKINTYYELMDLADELNNGEKIDWNNEEQVKFYFYYDADNDSLNIYATNYAKKIGEIYCLDKDFLDIAIEKIGEDRLKQLFTEE